ncbi:AMP-binding protein [Streptomyces sp. NPDC001978]|uniref:AMP-binding protein n=1 Tax=Streptomyces sp. NPDC001978 TaxID=3364627 RepID=UPI003693825F
MDLETPLPRLIAQAADSQPDRIFVEVAGTDTVLTYGEFHADVLRWSGAFTALGVSEGDYVATMLPNCVESYHCWLGLSWLRAIEAPVNPLFVGNTLAYPLNNAQAEVLVIDAAFVDRLVPIADALPHLRTVVVLDTTQPPPPLPWNVMTSDVFLEQASATPRLRTPRYHDPLAVIYTSGTTGPSKGVLQPWVNLHGMVQGIFPEEEAGAHPEGATFSCWPTFHSSGKFGMAIAPQFGLRMVFRPQFSLPDFWDDVRRHHITHAPLLVVGAMLMQQPHRPDDANNPLQHVGMYPLIPQYREFEKRFGVTVSAGYGNTEVGWPTTTTAPADNLSNGKVMPGYQVKIVNETGEELPTGEVGEIVVRHDLPWRLNKGYLAMPEATAEVWRDGWFHTGDAGRFDEDGNLSFVDRIKDSLRRRGHNISSFEVEAEVLAHPDVAECACVGVPSALARADDAVKDDDVKVFIVRHPSASLTEQELVDFLTSRVPRFMIPRYVEFIDALPKTPTGKVRKVELRSISNDGVWDREHTSPGGDREEQSSADPGGTAAIHR